MAFIGRYKLGDWLPLQLQTVNGSRVATTPDDVPTVKLFNSSGTMVYSQKLPVIERYVQTGRFYALVLLGRAFSTDTYTAVYYWTTGSGAYNGLEADNFDIVDGGHYDGNVIGMYFFDRPQAKYIVYQTDSGVLIQGRNPTVQ